jgi:hypothetical protein
MHVHHVTTLYDPGTSYTVAQGINDASQIVGYYGVGNAMGPQGFIATPTVAAPEPSSLAVACAGTLPGVCYAWRRRFVVRPR